MKLEKLQSRLVLVEKRDYKALFDNLSKANQQKRLKKYIALKKKLQKSASSGWVKIAASVSKIFVIAMAFVIVALNVTTTIPSSLCWHAESFATPLVWPKLLWSS